MTKRNLIIILFTLASINLTAQNVFDSVIIRETKNLLPTEIVTYTLNYCNKNVESNPYQTYSVLMGLKSYLAEHPNIKQWASYNYQLGNFYFVTDVLDSALNHYHYSLSSNEKLPLEIKTRIKLSISNIYTQQNNLTESINLLNEISNDVQKLNLTELFGILLMQQAINFAHDGNYAIASSQFERSFNYFKQSNDTVQIAQVYSNQAKMYASLNNYPMAIDLLSKSENIYRKWNNKWFLAKNQLEMGIMHYKASQYPDALRHLVSAEAIYKHYGEHIKLVDVYKAKGNIYTALRKYDQAEHYLSKALNYAILNNNQTALIYYSYGNLYYKKEEYNKAQHNYLKSLDINQAPQIKLALYEKLSDINSKLHNYKSAYKYQVLYNALQRNILSDEKNNKEARLKRDFEHQLNNTEAEKALIQRELSILLQSKSKRKVFYQLTNIALLLVVIILLFILIKKQKSNKKLHKHLTETIKLQRNEINQNTEKFNRLNKSSEQILSLSTKNIWEPFWVLENITNELVSQEFKNENLSKNKAFDDDQLIMARNLLENILYWSMNEQKQIEIHKNNFAIDEILKPIIQTQTIRAKAKAITLEYHQSSNPNLYIDKQTIQVALRNIIENAIKFSTQKGSILVSAKTINKHTEIVIHDDGVGMTKEQIKSLFSNNNPHQASGTHGEKGMGLGLNLAKSFIELNFGKINIESSVAYGTTVKITLPNQ